MSECIMVVRLPGLPERLALVSGRSAHLNDTAQVRLWSPSTKTIHPAEAMRNRFLHPVPSDNTEWKALHAAALEEWKGQRKKRIMEKLLGKEPKPPEPPAHPLDVTITLPRWLVEDAMLELKNLCDEVDQTTGGDDTTKGAKKTLHNIKVRMEKSDESPPSERVEGP